MSTMHDMNPTPYEQGYDKGYADGQPKWISVDADMPEEHDSIFAKLYGTERWRNAMFRKTSDEVIISVLWSNGKKHVTASHTIDGRWSDTSSLLAADRGMRITHWMKMPEPAQGGV